MTNPTGPELSKAVAEAIGWSFANYKLSLIGPSPDNMVAMTDETGVWCYIFKPYTDLEQAMQLAFNYKLTLYFSDRDIIWNNEYGEPIYLDFGDTTKSLCEAICRAVIQIEEDKKR